MYAYMIKDLISGEFYISGFDRFTPRLGRTYQTPEAARRKIEDYERIVDMAYATIQPVRNLVVVRFELVDETEV